MDRPFPRRGPLPLLTPIGWEEAQDTFRIIPNYFGFVKVRRALSLRPRRPAITVLARDAECQLLTTNRNLLIPYNYYHF
jgi:hypothetical protein